MITKQQQQHKRHTATTVSTQQLGLIFKFDGYADVTDDNADGNVFAAAGDWADYLLPYRWRDWYWELLCDSFCKFSNVKCHSYDKSKIVFKSCFLKAVRGEDSYMKVHAHLKEVGREANVSIRLLKRANGWKPFLYKVHFDGCKFMKNPRANPVAEFFYKIMKEYSNLNHTCPYDHDLILDKFRLSSDLVKLPFPIGEYAVDTTWFVNGQLWARVNGSCRGAVDM
ncbi:uncharacterized protein LOC120770621 [Bactrocera tryoni]|uniref:uncharacterized protein LOC120770621 n=1 Tax=Bactrocera tryoni TaxID=59916 RepID=UPI001A96EE89|nr:uncharacterized protein LOC120770621 [Bactrocera tryoni]